MIDNSISVKNLKYENANLFKTSGLVVVVHRDGDDKLASVDSLRQRNPDFTFAFCNVDAVSKTYGAASFGTVWEDYVLLEIENIVSKMGLNAGQGIVLGLPGACTDAAVLGLRGIFRAVILVASSDYLDGASAIIDSTEAQTDRDVDVFKSRRLGILIRNAGRESTPFIDIQRVSSLNEMKTSSIFSLLALYRPMCTVRTVLNSANKDVLIAENFAIIGAVLNQALFGEVHEFSMVLNGQIRNSERSSQELEKLQQSTGSAHFEFVQPYMKSSRFYPQGVAIVRGHPAKNYGSQKVMLVLSDGENERRFPLGNLIRKSISTDYFYQTMIDYSAAAFASGRHEGISLRGISEGRHEVSLLVQTGNVVVSDVINVKKPVLEVSSDGGALYQMSSDDAGTSITKWSLPGPNHPAGSAVYRVVTVRDNRLFVEGDFAIEGLSRVGVDSGKFFLTLSSSSEVFSYELRTTPTLSDTYGSWQGRYDNFGFRTPDDGLSLGIIPAGNYVARVNVLVDDMVYSAEPMTELVALTGSVNMESKVPAIARSIGILGSCVSRDNFNSRINPSWKAYFSLGCVHYQESLVSLMSEPVPFVNESFNELDEHDKAVTVRDFNKIFLNELHSETPDVLLVDLFADARFACISVGDSFITDNTWKLPKATSLYESLKSNPRIGMDVNPDLYLAEFRRCLMRLKELLESLPQPPMVVLNRARAVGEYSVDGKRMHFNQPFNVALNDRWSSLEGVFIEIFSPRLIDVMSPGMTSSADHPWGPANVHYEDRYYERFQRSLQDILGYDTEIGILTSS